MRKTYFENGTTTITNAQIEHRGTTIPIHKVDYVTPIKEPLSLTDYGRMVVGIVLATYFYSLPVEYATFIAAVILGVFGWITYQAFKRKGYKLRITLTNQKTYTLPASNAEGVDDLDYAIRAALSSR